MANSLHVGRAVLPPDAVTPTSSSIEAHVSKRPAAINRLLAAAAVPPPYADDAEAARGWLTRQTALDPSSTLSETFVMFRLREVIANDPPILAFLWQKIGNKADCCIGGMLESPPALLLRGLSSSPVAPAAQESPSLSASLSLTGKLRAVVDAGGALLPLTGRSRAVVNAVVALLPAAVESQAVEDASPSSTLPTDSLMSGNAKSVEPPSTELLWCGSLPSGGVV
jgi:hypothetical protein